MQITLDEDQVLLLIAVEQGRVHSDPRFKAPDFEKLAEFPFGQKRAGQRLQPLKKARLVALVPEDEADQYGVRAYKLTDLGERILAEVRQQEADARAEATA